MSEDTLTSSQAAELLGVSRQHVADLADRGEISAWRAGSHRRFHRQDVLAYRESLRSKAKARLSSLNLSDRRSLAYGLIIAAKLTAQPEMVIESARLNLARLRSVHSDGSADYYLDRWEELLGGPVEGLLTVLVALDEKSIALRHAAPFAGLLSDDERSQVISTTRTAA